jgi:hypothetical protein
MVVDDTGKDEPAARIDDRTGAVVIGSAAIENLVDDMVLNDDRRVRAGRSAGPVDDECVDDQRSNFLFLTLTPLEPLNYELTGTTGALCQRNDVRDRSDLTSATRPARRPATDPLRSRGHGRPPTAWTARSRATVPPPAGAAGAAASAARRTPSLPTLRG